MGSVLASSSFVEAHSKKAMLKLNHLGPGVGYRLLCWDGKS